jgi:hypothetical protein
MVGVVREMGHANNVKIVRVLALAPPPIIHRAIYYYVVLKGPRPIAAIEPLIISFPDKQSRTPELLPATAPSDPDISSRQIHRLTALCAGYYTGSAPNRIYGYRRSHTESTSPLEMLG